MNTLTLNQNRLDYLDGVRAFALLLGIIFHASLSFMPLYIGWAVMDISTSNIVSGFMVISHSFRMELFFLVAGFFSHMSFHRQGVQTFLKSRFVRIAIPFALAWFVLRPLLVSCWIMGAESLRGEVNIVPSLSAGFASLAQLPSGLFTGTHLWFLYYLLIATTVTLTLRYLLMLNKAVKAMLTQFTDMVISWCTTSRLAIVILAVPTGVCIWFMSHWGVDTPDKSLAPNIPVVLLYGGFFGFGWLLHRKAQFIEAFASLTWVKVVLCVLATAVTLWLLSKGVKLHHPHYYLLKTVFVFSYAVMMWSLVALTIGVFKRILARPNKMVRYLADSSYWLYLIHLPIVIWLQIAFAEVALHWGVKWLAVFVITIVVSLILYDCLVRATVIGQILNGKRKPRVLTLHSGKTRAAIAQ